MPKVLHRSPDGERVHESEEARSDFQVWLENALEKKRMSLAELARAVQSDYTHLWKILRGNPAKYPTSRRPGYDLTLAIGAALFDVEGALKSAGYELPASREPDPDRSAWYAAYDTLSERDRRIAVKLVREMQAG